MDEELLVMDEKRKWFLKKVVSWDGIYFCEDTLKNVKMTTMNFKNYINLVYKAAAEFERINSNFEKSCAVSKMQSNSLAWCCRDIFFLMKGRANHCSKLYCCLILRQFPDFSCGPVVKNLTQGTRVQYLVREDSTSCGTATEACMP